MGDDAGAVPNRHREGGQRRGRPGPGRVLSDSAIVEEALALLDRDGRGSLSLRGLAAVLGVRPNALYTYVADKAALEQLLVEYLLASADLDLLSGSATSWRTRIVDYSLSLRASLLEHPAVAPMLMTAPMSGPVALDLGERLLAALCDAGLTPEDAARASWSLIVYVVGSVALDAADTDGRAPLRSEDDRVQERLVAFESVPAQAYPLSRAVAPIMAAWISTSQFEWGLARVLAGLAPATG